MTPLKWLPAMVGLCSVILPLQGQTNDWLSVEKLARGTSISVVRHSRHDWRRDCELVKVTDSELACYYWIGRTDRTLVLARDQVREVRLEEPENNRMITGAIIGAAVGGLAGFLGGARISDPEARAYARFYGIPVGTLLGGAIGRNIHRHGAVVYRRP
jgi:hypothetical protein